MDIGKHDAEFGSPVLLTLVLLIVIPSSTGYIDCRISCRRCHENSEHPAVLEVYCAMCEECKQRRRERMLGRTTKGKVKPTLKSLMRKRDGVEASTDSEALIIRPQEALQARQDFLQQYQAQSQQQLQEPQQPQLTYTPHKALRGVVYPGGCPTPPICSDTEEEEEQPKETEAYTPSTTTTITTTTTTTQAPPCPPVTTCRKKKHINHPCMNPCMGPPPMCPPCPMYPPSLPPGPGYLHLPVQGIYEPHPCPQVQGIYGPNPPWPPSAFPPIGPHYDQQTLPPGTVPIQTPPSVPPQGPMVFSPTDQPSTMNEDFHYVFLGLPKDTI